MKCQDTFFKTALNTFLSFFVQAAAGPTPTSVGSQIRKFDLKSASADFAVMRQLAMRFRSIFRSRDAKKLDAWLDDAQQSGLYAMQRFVRTLRQDIDAVRNALTERWSNGQTEGQINRLKVLKRTMYDRASAELLRARMLPISALAEHPI